MAKYVCSVCGYIYDEAKGIPESGIPAGTLWQDLADDWLCPLCGASKEEFKRQGGESSVKKPAATTEISDDIKELTSLETSALCSNLARGCEKQYKFKEAELFTKLAGYFKEGSQPAKEASFDRLLELIEKDLQEGFPRANEAAAEDRGTLRALVWSEKVTRILKSLLGRYDKEGDAMFENTGVYVCTICGFIYIGDDLPDICPVCKVPNWKFEEIQGGRDND